MNRAATPHSRELDQTPTWAIAIVVAVIILLSIVLEKVLHRVGEREEEEDQSTEKVILVRSAELTDVRHDHEIIKEETIVVANNNDSWESSKENKIERWIKEDEDQSTEKVIVVKSAEHTDVRHDHEIIKEETIVVANNNDSCESSKENKIERWIKDYSSSHSILLVGEGDFSFSACLAKAFGSASNMVATTLDSQDMLHRRLPGSELHIEYLRKLGCLILHEVDVHAMASAYPELVNMKFDRIVFNFPHSGHFGVSGQDETNRRVIKRHRTLLSGFFKSSSKMLCGTGEVHVAHRDDHPYNAWDIEKLADEAGLTLIKKSYFAQFEYPGYCNKRGSYSRPAESFPLGNCPTMFKFSLKLDYRCHGGGPTKKRIHLPRGNVKWNVRVR